MRDHIFTIIKNDNKKKRLEKKSFFSYFISEIPNFSYMAFIKKCPMFRQSTPLKPCCLNFSPFDYKSHFIVYFVFFTQTPLLFSLTKITKVLPNISDYYFTEP